MIFCYYTPLLFRPCFIGLKSGNRNSAFADFVAALRICKWIADDWRIKRGGLPRVKWPNESGSRHLPGGTGRPLHIGLFYCSVLGLCGCCCCGRSCLWRCWRFRLAGLVIIVLVIIVFVVTFVAVAVAVLLRQRRRRQRQRLLIFRLLPTMIDQAGEQRRVTSCCRSSC